MMWTGWTGRTKSNSARSHAADEVIEIGYCLPRCICPLIADTTRPTSWGLAIMEEYSGTLCRTGSIAEADNDLHCRSDRKDRARRGCIPGELIPRARNEQERKSK